jgi:hypothetical protein
MKGWLVAAALLAGLTGKMHGQGMPMGGHEQMAHAPAKPSTTLRVTIDGKATVLTVADLAAMPQTTVTAKNGHTGVVETYSGVAVGDLLAKLGFTFDNATAKRTYHSYVRAEGTDGYWVLFSASELIPALRETGSLIALALDGKPLGEDGAIRMIVAGERRPARWVRNLKSLTVVTLE